MRYFIYILLFTATAIFGQDTLTQTLAGDTIGSVLVDCASDFDTELFRLVDNRKPADYGDSATAAYSLRYVTDSYDSVVVRVRRSSDNAELDFYPQHIGDSLETWVSAGNDGFVTIWYDQMNGNHATQATASKQPKIVDAGALVTENGKAAIDFDGMDDRLSGGNVLDMGTNDLSIFATAKQVVLNDGWFVSKASTSVNEGYGIFHQDLARFRALIRIGGSNISTSSSSGEAVTSQGLSTAIFDRSADLNAYFNGAFSNGVDISGISGNDISNNIDFYIGYAFFNVDRYYGGLLQEIIIYNSDQSSNRGNIESQINSYYNISSTIPDLTDSRIIRQTDSLKLVTGQADTTFIGLPTAEDRIALTWESDTIRVSLNGADAVSKGVNYTQDYTEWFFSTQRPVTYYELIRWAIRLTNNEIKTLTK